MSSPHDDTDDFTTEEEEEEEEEEENPNAYPWNKDIMSKSYETFAKLVARCDGHPVHPNHPKLIEVKEVALGDPLQARTKGAASTFHTIKKDVAVMCVGPDDDLPYLGLVTRIFMRKPSIPNGQGLHRTSKFWLEVYWLYRMQEVANFVDIEPRFSKDRLSGGVFDGSKEEGSERQIMFSCHSSFGDNADDAVALSSCLHPVEVHWLLPDDPVPQVYYEDNKGQLRSRRAPGFYIRYFLRWGGENAKDQGVPKVYSINSSWDHAVTMQTARRMRQQYLEKAKVREAKNAELMRKHSVSTQQQSRRSSEDGGPKGAPKQQPKLKRLQQTGRK